MKKVSVAIGTWNRFEMVSQAIDAALAQTYPVHEIVVYDDCSPDNSYIRLKEKYANEPKVKVFSQPVNTGGVPNWNAAINACEGEYIAWCSDDDRFLPWHIEKAVIFFEKEVQADAFQCGIYLFNDDGSPHDDNNIKINLESGINVNMKSQHVLKTSGIDFFKFIISNFSGHIQPSTLVFKREVWSLIGQFNSEYELADSKWLLDVSQKCNLYYLPYIATIVRRHENNWSNKMGSINMQKEFNQMINIKFKERKLYDRSFQLQFLHNKWNITFLFLLIRIFIARSRAGIMNVAFETLNYISDVYLFKNKIYAKKYFISLFMLISKLIYKMEKLIFGNKSKYINDKIYYPK